MSCISRRLLFGPSVPSLLPLMTETPNYPENVLKRGTVSIGCSQEETQRPHAAVVIRATKAQVARIWCAPRSVPL